MMTQYQVIALGQQTVDEVRQALRAPGYGHPAHVEVATGCGPCRLCLRTFRMGEEERILFTYNPFPGDAEMPSPGPIFVHKESCPRHEGSGFPPGLSGLPLTLEGYDRVGAAVAREKVADDPGSAVDRLFSSPRVAYAHIRNTEAGCFIARIDRIRPVPEPARS
jgi:hypothetical protein